MNKKYEGRFYVHRFNENSESKSIHHLYISKDLPFIYTCNLNYFKMNKSNDFQEAKTYLYNGHWKYGRNMTFMDLVSDRMLVKIA